MIRNFSINRVHPLSGECLIEMLPPEAISDGGIHIPELDQELSTKGIVRRMGPWPKNDRGLGIPPDFKRGDKVVVSNRVGRQVIQGEDKFRLVPMNRVLAVLTS